VDRSAVTQRVWELAEPLLLTSGLELVDVQFRPEGGRTVLRLLIDRPEGGVTLDQLTRISREMGDVLDGHDAVPGRYHLECSSPGINRPLTRAEHFKRVVGKCVRVRTREPIAGRRQFKGTLADVAADGVGIQDPEVGAVHVPFADIEKANLEFDLGRPAHPPRTHA